MNDDNDDPASRVRAVLGSGIAAIEAQMAALRKGKLDVKKTSAIVDLTIKSATILSHVRRYDQAMREAGRALSPAVVIAWLRALPPERLRPIMAEVGEEPDDDASPSVLS